MNNETLLLDTNSIMYLIKGDKTVLQLLDKRPVAINFITEIELFGWPNMTMELEQIIKAIISDAQYFDYSSRVKDLTIALRQKYRLKLGDAFIASTATEYDLPLVSADKGFSKVAELRLINFIPST